MPHPPSADDCFRLARGCLDGQDVVQASHWLEQCLRLDPAHGAAWHLLGTVQARCGREEEALASQCRSCALHPQLGWNWFAAGELFERREAWPQAHHHFQQAARWLKQETWIRQRVSLAAERALLGGESLATGLGPQGYRIWCRQLEPALPVPQQALRDLWWSPGPGGRWRRLRDDLAPGTDFDPGVADGWPEPDGWLLLLAPDALLRCGALSALEESLTAGDGVDLLYPDEDRLDEAFQRCDPWFKPDWVLESFWSTPWLDALSVWRIGWLRAQGLEPPPSDRQRRWTWLLGALERTPRIRHVPRILVHRMGHPEPGSESFSRFQAEELRRHLVRQGERVQTVQPLARGERGFAITWKLGDPLPRVRVVIPTRDSPDLLERCLSSLEATCRAIVPDLVVIDHASQEPATADMLQQWCRRLGPRLRVMRNDEPFNWSRLNNLGAADADTELLLFLNDDVEALEPGWLDVMAAQAMRPAIGCVGAVLLYPDGRLQHAGMVLGYGPEPGATEHAYRGLPETHAVHRGRSRFLSGWPAVTGACLMVRRELFREVGGFEEALPVEGNDVAFCLALQERGWRHVVEPSARLLHRECQSRDPSESPTAAPALAWLRSSYPAALASPRPWWPPACCSGFIDGRPQGFEGFGLASGWPEESL